MRRAGRIAGLVGAAFAWSLLGCNSILGIDAATLEPDAQGASGSSSGVTEGGTSGTSGAADAGAGAEGGGLPFPQDYTDITCDNYCNLITEGCPFQASLFDTEYLSPAVCSAMCSVGWEPTGDVLDPSTQPAPSDSLGCRIWHANAAIEGYPHNDPHTHCPHAGPLGGLACDPGGSDYCTPFCRLDVAICNGDNAQYPGGTTTDQMAACLAACGADAGYPGYPYVIDATGNVTTDLVPQGDTINCRMYHLENAIFTGDPITHCPHTSQAGGGPGFCGPDAGM